MQSTWRFDHHDGDEGEVDEVRVDDVMTWPMLLLGSDLIDLFVEEAFDYSWLAWVYVRLLFSLLENGLPRLTLIRF